MAELVAGEAWQMWAVFALAAAVFWLYARERWPLETISIGLLAVLVLLFHWFPLVGEGGENLLPLEALLAGFANPALLSVLALIVMGQGLLLSRLLEGPARFLLALRLPFFLLPGLTFIAGFIVSAFLNNTPVVVMFIPVLAALAAMPGGRAGQMMMPLSFACILGGMTTLVGSSTNLLAAQAAQEHGSAMIGFFDLTIPALILGVPAMAYILFIMPRLLPGAPSGREEGQAQGGRQYIIEVLITRGHLLEGVKAQAGGFPSLNPAVVLMIERDGRPLAKPFEGVMLRAGDVIVLAATRNEVADLIASNPALLGMALQEGEREAHEALSEDKAKKEATRLLLAESVIIPASRMLGRSMEQLDLRREAGCVALGVQRRGDYAHTAMRSLRLEAGDVLLLLGNAQALRRLARSHEVLLLDGGTPALPDKVRPRTALAIFAATIVCMASGLLPVVVAALAGAAAMIAAGVLNVRQAARAIDRRIFLMVGAMLGLAAAMDASGGANFLASVVIMAAADAPPVVILSLFFLSIALITNLLTNNATAVLFTPIAVSIALETGLPIGVFVITLILAANCSFATPMGYQTNLLVMGPGGYQFRDYLRAGSPLVLLLWLVYTLLVPAYYGF